jgi:hypothetical protein
MLDLNKRPIGYQPIALTAELISHTEDVGFEPTDTPKVYRGISNPLH